MFWGLKTRTSWKNISTSTFHDNIRYIFTCVIFRSLGFHLLSGSYIIANGGNWKGGKGFIMAIATNACYREYVYIKQPIFVRTMHLCFEPWFVCVLAFLYPRRIYVDTLQGSVQIKLQTQRIHLYICGICYIWYNKQVELFGNIISRIYILVQINWTFLLPRLQYAEETRPIS